MIDQPLGGAPDRLVSEKTAAEILNISADTLRRLGKRGEGPKRRQISTRRVGYRLSEIDAFLTQSSAYAAVPAPPPSLQSSGGRCWMAIDTSRTKARNSRTRAK
jgi:predicted DNA-binding transcriptional regulator AlpA